MGEKTAAKWIREYGSFDGLVEHVDSVKGKVGDALREHLASVMRNRQLTELVRDVPLDLDLASLQRQAWDRDQVHTLFDNLQFRVLRERLFALTATEPEAEEGFDIATTRLGPNEVAAWLDDHARDGNRVGVAFRGTWGRGTGTLTGIALAAADGAAGYLQPDTLTEADDKAFAGWLEDPAVPKAVHDVKGPVLALRQHGWSLAGVSVDTQLAAYLALPGQRSFDLADLALRYLHRELRANDADLESGQLTLDGGLDEADDALAQVETVRASAVRDLADALDTDLEERGATRLLAEMELPLTFVLADMEAVGIAVDADKLLALQAELGAAVKAVEQDAHAVVGRTFNLGSPKQLQEILFDQFGLPKTKRIKTGYTTDADALAHLYEQTGHPVLEHLLRHREVARLKTVVDSLLPLIDDAGRIHTTFNQTIAATGRLSSTDPNLQNIPVRTAEGRRIREAFTVGAGLRVAHDRRLQPDRDADHGAPVPRRRADRGVHHGRGPAHLRRVARVRPAARADRSGVAPAGQGDVLRPGLRPVRVRARSAAQDHCGGSARADGGLLRPLRRRARLPALDRRGRASHGLHRDDHGPAPLPARPHQRQPAAP